MSSFANGRGGFQTRPYELELEEYLDSLQQKDLYRKLRVLEPVDAVHARGEGRTLTLFCGNDYLGLSHDPRLQEAMQKAVTSAGVGATASRLISGTSLWHQKLEQKIAEFKKKEAALVYSAGYLANLGVLTALAGKDDCIVMDKLCHASLIDGARLSGAAIRVFPHKNYERCEEILQKLPDAGKKILISDTVFSMDGDTVDIAKLVEIKKHSGAILVLDDAHGTGVMGPTGRGAAENWEQEIDVITGTFSKACAGLGGFAAASRTVCDYLINTSRPFIFATALPPPVCAAAHEALCIFERSPQLREKLWANVRYFQSGLKEIGVGRGEALSPIIPVICGPENEALRAAQILLEKGFLCPAVRTPTVPKGKARLRITISAAHQEKDLNGLLRALKVTVTELL